VIEGEEIDSSKKEIDSSKKEMERKVKGRGVEVKKLLPNSSCPFLDPIHSTNSSLLLLRVFA